jgi:hypothetical protein
MVEITRDADGRITNDMSTPEKAAYIIAASPKLTDLLREDVPVRTRETPTHSPGPFTLDDSCIHGRVFDANGRRVATVYGTVADERLFLKAPELLAACRTFCLRVERGEVQSRKTYAAMKALVDHVDGTGADE